MASSFWLPLGGGKFANGAVTGAFSHLFNSEHKAPKKQNTLVLLEESMAAEKSDTKSKSSNSIDDAWNNAASDINKQSGGRVDIVKFYNKDSLFNSIKASAKEYDVIIISTHGSGSLARLGNREMGNAAFYERKDFSALFTAKIQDKISWHGCSSAGLTFWVDGVNQVRANYNLAPAKGSDILSYSYTK